MLQVENEIGRKTEEKYYRLEKQTEKIKQIMKANEKNKTHYESKRKNKTDYKNKQKIRQIMKANKKIKLITKADKKVRQIIEANEKNKTNCIRQKIETKYKDQWKHPKNQRKEPRHEEKCHHRRYRQRTQSFPQHGFQGVERKACPAQNKERRHQRGD